MHTGQPSESDFPQAPAGTRIFTQRMRPSLGDCAPGGRIRLDGLARWLQDIAYSDVEDAGLAAHAYWVVRRTRIAVLRWPRFSEWFTVSTFCTGLGRMWAERRTTIRPEFPEPGGEAAVVEAAAIWVHLDAESRRPTPFAPDELETYAGPAPARRVSAKLRHPLPPPDATGTLWQFHGVDCDIAGHVNNAAYWRPLEEELLTRPEEPAEIETEIEFRSGAQPGEHRVLSAGTMRWLADSQGAVLASIDLRSDPAAGLASTQR